MTGDDEYANEARSGFSAALNELLSLQIPAVHLCLGLRRALAHELVHWSICKVPLYEPGI